MTAHTTDTDGPTMGDLRRASAEAHLRPVQKRIDEMVAALPWHGRLLYRLVLPIARLTVRRKP